MTSGRTVRALDYVLKGLRFESRPGSCELFLGRDPWWDLVNSITGLPTFAEGGVVLSEGNKSTAYSNTQGFEMHSLS